MTLSWSIDLISLCHITEQILAYIMSIVSILKFLLKNTWYHIFLSAENYISMSIIEIIQIFREID